tara:strand:+ start:43 stop:615 length:573 start_codon:yes stop_codon:yes gene_type:complete
MGGRAMKVKTIERSHPDWDEYCDELVAFVSNDSNDKLKENYTKEKFEFNKTIAITLNYNEHDELTCFSTVLHREMFGNAVRILNRMYRASKHRYKIQPVTDQTKETIRQQIDVAKRAGYDVVFMSRENKFRGKGSSLSWYTKYLPQEWVVCAFRHKVCPDGPKDEIWHNIAYHQLTDTIDEFKILRDFII